MTNKTIIFLTTIIGVAAAAHAQTWVSAATGNDANACTRTAPCKTFQRAVNVTPAWGQVGVLDPGDYGSVTISQSVTIDGGGLASNVTTTSVSITVQAGSGIVQLRNLSLHGTGSASHAILYNSGAQLVMENMKINGFNDDCVRVGPGNNADLVIKDTSIDNCSAAAMNLSVAAGDTLTAEIINTHMHYTNGGLLVLAGIVSVVGSTISGLGSGSGDVGVTATGGTVMLDNCEISSTEWGIQAVNSTVQVSRSTISSTQLALYTFNASIISNGNNSLFNNFSNGAFTSTVALQ
jgi:hypothetical protein